MNNYEPPQVTECRGPCGDSGCPHKPKERTPNKWLHDLAFVAVGGIFLSLIVYLMFKHSEAEAYKKWGPQPAPLTQGIRP